MKHPVFKITAISFALALASQQASALTATERQLLEQVRILSEKVAELERKTSTTAAPVVETKALDQKVRVIERKLELADEEAAKAKASAPIITASEKGFSIKSADSKSFEIKFRGLVQADARIFDDGSIRGQSNADPSLNRDAKDDFLLRRVRPTIEGTIFKDYDFKITSEFGNNSTSLIDAYVDSRLADKALALRVGKFIPPLGLEHIQGSSNTKFSENSFTAGLTPSRDIGLQLHGKVASDTVEYAVGIFNGALDGTSGDRDVNTDKDLAARIFLQPFVNTPGIFQGLSFGVAASKGDADGRIGENTLPTYRTPGQETLFGYRGETSTGSVVSGAVFASGKHDRVIPQFTWYTGSFGLLGELAKTKQDVTRVSGGATTREETLDQDAWTLTASYLLTGEEASFKGVKPANSVGKGGWGAWELIARVSELEIDKDTFTDLNGELVASSALTFADPARSIQQAKSWAVGVNWYPNSILRASLNYEKTSFDWGGGGTSANPLDREDEKVLTGRLQASF